MQNFTQQLPSTVDKMHVTQPLKNFSTFYYLYYYVQNSQPLNTMTYKLKPVNIITTYLTWYCRDHVSSYNIYAVQQDTQKWFNEWDYSSCMLAWHVSDLTGSSSGAFYKLYSQISYVVIRVLLDTSSCYEVVGRTSCNFVKAGPMRSETCRANKECWMKLTY